MSYDVHISVCFECYEKETLSAIAKKHKVGMLPREADWFLEACIEGKGYNGGPKGSLFTWGIVGNYTNVADFCKILKPFWIELFASGYALSFYHILVFEEQEQQEKAIAYEIYMDDAGELIIKKHLCPFAWMQY